MPPNFKEQALALHREALVVDLHADTSVLMRFGYHLGRKHDPLLPRSAALFHLDLPRMQEGGLTAQFFGLPSAPWRIPFVNTGPFQATHRLLDALDRAEQTHSETFTFARTKDAILKAKASGRIAGLRGIEGAHALEGNLAHVASFSARGIAYLGLVHFTKNEIGRPAYGYGANPTNGLTPFGFSLIEALNEQRIIVDLAHLNRSGVFDATTASTSPVIISHTGVCGVHRHWRNIDDEQIRAIAKTGGCIGVIFSRRYLGTDDLHGVCDHLEHLIRIGGEDLPALGSDFDGCVTPPRGLEDISCLPNLTSALLSRGLKAHQIKKCLGENALRVLKDVCG